jgi:predicted ABC-type ATPase
MIWFIAGINGAGKSTLTGSSTFRTALGITEIINPDDWARSIQKVSELPYPLCNLCAAILTQSKVFSEALFEKEPKAAIETVLSSEKFEPVLDIAERRRVAIGLVYVGIDSIDLALQRIRTRVAAGQHDVPAPSVKKRWERTRANLYKWAPRVDNLLVYANNYVDKPPVLVAMKASKISQIAILDRKELPEIAAKLEDLNTPTSDVQSQQIIS